MSIAKLSDRLLTAEEFFQSANNESAELVQGRVLEMSPPGFRHGSLQLHIGWLLKNHSQGKGIGEAIVEGGILTTHDPDTVRAPDISFFSKDRLPAADDASGYATTAPEVVFEILSPSQRLSELADKANEYLVAGVLAVCVVDPDRRSVVVYAENEGPRILTEQDELTLPAPLEGWKPRVKDFFPEGPRGTDLPRPSSEAAVTDGEER